MILKTNDMIITLSSEKASITSFIIKNKERLFSDSPIFRIMLRHNDGSSIILSSLDATSCFDIECGVKCEFNSFKLSICVSLTKSNEEFEWRVVASPESDEYFVEWIELAPLTLPALSDNNKCGDGGKVIFPYNEGVLISNINRPS